MSRIKSIIIHKCPKCENGDVYEKGNLFSFGKMNETCPSCNYKFEIEPGFFFGAMFVCYALTIAEGLGAFIFSQFFFKSIYPIIATIFLVIIGLSPINFKLSRVTWMYIFTSSKGTI